MRRLLRPLILRLSCLAAWLPAAAAQAHGEWLDAGPLAYRPFLEPAPIDRYWLWCLPPLVIGITVVYQTIKSDDLSAVPRRAAYLTLQILVFLAAAALGLWAVLRLF